jgi:hypothetical protein
VSETEYWKQFFLNLTNRWRTFTGSHWVKLFGCCAGSEMILEHRLAAKAGEFGKN